MEVCVLASGSKGNCVYVAGGGTAVLVDLGLAAREVTRRMALAGLDPARLEAVLFTHDHIDHYRGVKGFSKRFPVRLLANEGTAGGIEVGIKGLAVEWDIFETAATFELRGLRVEAFTVSHDAADPVGFVFDDGTARVCVVTDLGQATPLVAAKLAGCDAAVVESNHDLEMLMQSARPWALKTRIAGRSGHLSNVDAAELVCDAAAGRLRTALLAHLSEECNTPALALNTMRQALRERGHAEVRVEVMQQAVHGERFVFG